MDAVNAKSSGSYVKFMHIFCLKRSKMVPVQHPHCPSMQEHGNLSPWSGLFVVVDANIGDMVTGASVTFFDVVFVFVMISEMELSSKNAKIELV